MLLRPTVVSRRLTSSVMQTSCTYLSCFEELNVVLPNICAFFILADMIQGKLICLAYGVPGIRTRVHAPRQVRLRIRIDGYPRTIALRVHTDLT